MNTMRLPSPRVDLEEFLALPLRAHEFLADVDLVDVWRLTLRGGPPLTLQSAMKVFADIEKRRVDPASRALFALRSWLGRVFKWDAPDPMVASRSYINRLTANDVVRSLEKPGSRRGFWHTVYTFEKEGLGEVINRTVHAFLLFTLVRNTGHSSTVFWAIYVKPVSRFTPFYMALINPFRRRLIYPALIRRYEEAWATRSGADAMDSRLIPLPRNNGDRDG